MKTMCSKCGQVYDDMNLGLGCPNCDENASRELNKYCPDCNTHVPAGTDVCPNCLKKIERDCFIFKEGEKNKDADNQKKSDQNEFSVSGSVSGTNVGLMKCNVCGASLSGSESICPKCLSPTISGRGVYEDYDDSDEGIISKVKGFFDMFR